MKINDLYIFPQDKDAHLTAYIREITPSLPYEPRDAVLICPGGGYEHVSARENEPVALAFLARGYNVFTLTYSVGDLASDLRPLTEAALAIKHIREHAEEYHIDPSRIFILGFSAGGHLALSSAVLYDCDALSRLLPEVSDARILRPDATVLCYPVVTATCDTHLGTVYHFCGTDHPSGEPLELFCLEKHINEQTPPTFIWHTEDDDCVPVENSLLLDRTLERYGVEHELHLFPHGVHGLSLATHETCPEIAELQPHPASVWINLADAWLKRLPR